MIIRPCHDGDLLNVVTLFRDTVQQVNQRDYSPEQIAVWAPRVGPDLGWWRDRIAPLRIWVAEREGELVGFAGLGESGYIDFLYVHHRFQRQGVGRSLYEKIEAEVKLRNLKRLYTEASITAQPFFERMGFTILREQTVKVRGVPFQNFAMEKNLE